MLSRFEGLFDDELRESAAVWVEHNEDGKPVGWPRSWAAADETYIEALCEQQRFSEARRRRVRAYLRAMASTEDDSERDVWVHALTLGLVAGPLADAVQRAGYEDQAELCRASWHTDRAIHALGAVCVAAVERDSPRLMHSAQEAERAGLDAVEAGRHSQELSARHAEASSQGRSSVAETRAACSEAYDKRLELWQHAQIVAGPAGQVLQSSRLALVRAAGCALEILSTIHGRSASGQPNRDRAEVAGRLVRELVCWWARRGPRAADMDGLLEAAAGAAVDAYLWDRGEE